MKEKNVAELESDWDPSSEFSENSENLQERAAPVEDDTDNSLQLPHKTLWQDRGSFVYAADEQSKLKSDSFSRRHTVDGSAVHWDRRVTEITAGGESSTEATMTPCAAEISSSASSASFASKSPNSSSISAPKSSDSKSTDASPTTKPRLKSDITVSSEPKPSGQKRPRVRLSERASRVAVYPHRGSKFLDPVSMMGLVQRQQNFCGSARRTTDERIAMTAVQSYDMSRPSSRSNSQPYSTNVTRAPLREALETNFKAVKASSSGSYRCGLEASRLNGRLSCPHTLVSRHLDSRSHHSTESGHSSAMKRRDSARPSMLEASILDRNGLTLHSSRRRVHHEDLRTSVDRDVLWLAVQHHRAAHRKRKSVDSPGLCSSK